MSRKIIWGIGIILGTILGFVGLRICMYLYTDWLWFEHLGYASVFLTMAKAKVTLLAIFWTFFVAFAGGNIWFALIFGQKTKEFPLEVFVGDTIPTKFNRVKRQQLIWGGIIVTIGFFVAVGGMLAWIPALRYLHTIDFGIRDPIFQHELSFFVFNLPVYTFLQGWLTVALFIIALLVGISYLKDRSIRHNGESWVSSTHVSSHFSILGAIFALLMAWGYGLKEYELLYSFRKNTFFGAGYTDLHAQNPAYGLMLILSVLIAIILLLNLYFKGWKIPRYSALGYISAVIIFSWLGPILFEQFIVKPNELTLETPFIRHSIDFTRKAYGLNNVEEIPFPAKSNLTFQDIQKNQAIIQSIPLWDRRPLIDTYKQLQEIRSYYQFRNVDADRYRINGDYRQVMLSVREFSLEQLSLRGETWVNRHLVYTHGYGLCMSPSNEIVGDGLPEFYIRDIPPFSSIDLNINRPEIYYGENTKDYVVVGSKTPEFDYPKGDENSYTSYGGRGGIPINSFFRRLAFSLRFGDPYLFFTDNLTPKSRILFDRHIGSNSRDEGPKRFKKLAPFLRFDKDPYLAVIDSRLVWIQDAYTVTNMFPYSEPHGRPFIREMNYIRNSVKATMDAYDGTVTFYVWDSTDPLIQSYQKIFPKLFQPKEAIKISTREHLRYPIDLFQIQSSLFNTYHMTSPQVFYNREDVWETAYEIYGISEKPKKMDPYYVMVKFPDSDQHEYVLMLPATPAKKPNMIAWLFARCDALKYGQLMVYKLPKEKLIYGPLLLERRIDQDTDISREITLWSQRGSDVIRGNLLVIPIENSFIYVEPLYLQATQDGMPELKRVLVFHGEKLEMGKTLDVALSKLFSPDEINQSIKPQYISDIPANRTESKTLARKALNQLEFAQEQLKLGRFSKYGESISNLRSTLIEMNRREATNGN